MCYGWGRAGRCCAAASILGLALVLGVAADEKPPAPKSPAQQRAAQRQQAIVPVQRSLERALQSTNGYREPEELAYGGYHVLHVRQVKTALLGAADGEPQEIEVLSYNGRLVGPTLRVRRGTRLRLRVVNHLPGEDADHNEGDIPHGFCHTNLHTHGLHVSPTDPSDNVFRTIAPGKSHLFEFDIPPDHPAGTFWYHPHRHGSVAYQVTSGMAGALIVEGSPGDKIIDLENIPEIAAARQRVLVFQQYQYFVQDDKVGRVDARDIYGDQPPGVTLPRGCLSPDKPGQYGECTAINGVVLPTYELAPAEVQRWRFIHAGREDPIELVWHDSKDQPTAALDFNVIAVDGLATGSIRKTGSVRLDPGNRSDVLIKAPADDGVYLLTANSLPQNLTLRGVAVPQRYLALVRVRGSNRGMELPTSAKLTRCRAMEPVADKEVVNLGKPRRLQFDSDDKTFVFNINGVPFSHQKEIWQLRLQTAEEWVVTALRKAHVFHVHVNPFQVVRAKKSTLYQPGEWRDTLFVEEGDEIVIRTRFRDFPGQSVLHCHILDHEDQGMMHKIQFVDGKNGPAPQGTGLQETDIRAPRLCLPDADGRARVLTDFRGSNVLLVFFRGMGCAHCTGQLRALLRDARVAGATDFQVVAVSSEPVADPVKAVHDLRRADTPSFHLLIDTKQQAFQSFGCFATEPQHGLFLIDRAGKIRARYVGPRPLDETGPILACMRRLADQPAPAR